MFVDRLPLRWLAAVRYRSCFRIGWIQRSGWLCFDPASSVTPTAGRPGQAPGWCWQAAARPLEVTWGVVGVMDVVGLQMGHTINSSVYLCENAA